MLNPIVYLFLLAFEFFFVIAITIYLISLLFSSFKGSPYVPTKSDEADKILQAANLKTGQRFLDLGCGDGRLVQKAVQQYKVEGTGIDINPVILFWAKLKAKWAKTNNIVFMRQNIFAADLRNYDVIYLFLFPDLLQKLKSKLSTQTKPNVLIISHGFQIEGWDKYCYKSLRHKPFPTYYYRLA